MLTRSSQIGEFYVMSPPQVKPEGDGKFTCDLLIYDEESDRHVRITWRDALKATFVNTTSGDVGDQTKQAMAGGGDSQAWATQAEEWAKFSEGNANAKTYENILKANAAAIDCRIVIARPFIEHMMVRRRPPFPSHPLANPTAVALAAQHNVILTVAGRDTGATRTPPLLLNRRPYPRRSRSASSRAQCSARRTCSFLLTLRSRRSRVRDRPSPAAHACAPLR